MGWRFVHKKGLAAVGAANEANRRETARLLDIVLQRPVLRKPGLGLLLIVTFGLLILEAGFWNFDPLSG